jgi:uncharacterized membrane protein
MSNIEPTSPQQWPHPNPARLSIEKWAAWATYLLAPASFIISVFAIFLATFGVYYTVQTYSATKDEELRIDAEKV